MTLPSRDRKLALIFGISSHLGRLLAVGLAADGYSIFGTYRRRTPETDSLRAIAGEHHDAVGLFELDVLDTRALYAFLDTQVRPRCASVAETAFVYCCGTYHLASAASLTAEEFDAVLGVGLRAPCLISAFLLRNAQSPVKIILVTGLGGEKAAVAGNCLYATCTNGIYSFVKAVGMELAGGPSSCTGISLGLFDKQQPDIHERCAQLNIRRPGDMNRVSLFIRQLAIPGTFYLNGAIVELADGLFNYDQLNQLLRKGGAG